VEQAERNCLEVHGIFVSFFAGKKKARLARQMMNQRKTVIKYRNNYV